MATEEWGLVLAVELFWLGMRKGVPRMSTHSPVSIRPFSTLVKITPLTVTPPLSGSSNLSVIFVSNILLLTVMIY